METQSRISSQSSTSTQLSSQTNGNIFSGRLFPSFNDRKTTSEWKCVWRFVFCQDHRRTVLLGSSPDELWSSGAASWVKALRAEDKTVAVEPLWIIQKLLSLSVTLTGQIFRQEEFWMSRVQLQNHRSIGHHVPYLVQVFDLVYQSSWDQLRILQQGALLDSLHCSLEVLQDWDAFSSQTEKSDLVSRAWNFTCSAVWSQFPLTCSKTFSFSCEGFGDFWNSSLRSCLNLWLLCFFESLQTRHAGCWWSRQKSLSFSPCRLQRASDSVEALTGSLLSN